MSPSVAEAFVGCVRANPTLGLCYENSGRYHLMLAGYRFVAHLDERSALAVAGERLLEGSALLHRMSVNLESLAALELLRVRVALRDGRDPSPGLAALRLRVADCLRVDPKDADCVRVDADARALAQSASGGK
jgi:hypothetical protein